MAQAPDDSGCYPLEIAVNYGASLDVVMRLVEAFPSALERQSYKYSKGCCMGGMSESPTSTMATSFSTFMCPIPFEEIRRVVEGSDFGKLGVNMRKFLSRDKRQEIMVLCRLCMRKEDEATSSNDLRITGSWFHGPQFDLIDEVVLFGSRFLHKLLGQDFP